jgi:hypothetical protein
MKTALEIVQEACRTMGTTRATSFTDTTNKTTQMFLGSLNRTAEDLTLTNNWLSQTRLKTFTLDKQTQAYNQVYEGFDLDVLTDNCFERFSSSFLWDMTDKVRVDGITIDKFIQAPALVENTGDLRFLRMGKYLKFYPNDTGSGWFKSKHDIQFYYQTKMVCHTDLLPSVIEADTISDDKQIPYHNAKLLLRGILLNYARNEGLDTGQFQDDYDKFLKKCIVEEAPSATIKFMSSYGENFLGSFPFIGG